MLYNFDTQLGRYLTRASCLTVSVMDVEGGLSWNVPAEEARWHRTAGWKVQNRRHPTDYGHGAAHLHANGNGLGGSALDCLGRIRALGKVEEYHRRLSALILQHAHSMDLTGD